MLMAMHANFSLAQDPSQDVSTEQINTLELGEHESKTITWPLLPGENVQSLSSLFYPKNRRMQRLFVQRTLDLNQDTLPNLNAYTTTNQTSLIVIPNIKYLAKYGSKVRRTSTKVVHHKALATQPEPQISHDLGNVNQFILTTKVQVKYEDLVKRNEQFEQDLARLNVKLAHLQEAVELLKVVVKREQSLSATPQISNVLPTPISSESVVSAASPVTATSVSELVQPKVIPRAVVSPPTQTTASTTIIPMTGQESFTSRYGLQTLLALLVLGSIFSTYLYKRRQTDAFKNSTVDKLEPMDKKEFVVTIDDVNDDVKKPTVIAGSSLTSSEFSGSITDSDLDVIISLKNKEESDLVLEQARIYVNIDREKEAILILKAQIQSAPKASLDHWLALLDIYRKTNEKEEFLESAHQLHQTFNVIQPTWDNLPLPMVIATSLLEFPHIIEPLVKLWGECDKDLEKLVEAKVYLDTLLTDNRDSERSGFGLEVLLEIKLLRDILDLRDKFSNQA